MGLIRPIDYGETRDLTNLSSSRINKFFIKSSLNRLPRRTFKNIDAEICMAKSDWSIEDIVAAKEEKEEEEEEKDAKEEDATEGGRSE